MKNRIKCIELRKSIAARVFNLNIMAKIKKNI